MKALLLVGLAWNLSERLLPLHAELRLLLVVGFSGELSSFFPATRWSASPC